MQNLEIKVRCINADMLLELENLAIREGAKYVETINQRDTYFAVPQGRLKLREWKIEDIASPRHEEERAESGNTLVGYSRPDEQGTRLSHYILSPIPEAETLIGALRITLGIRVVVDKLRRLVMYGSTRIHFDQVAGLGAFVELETVISQKLPEQAALEEHNHVIEMLGLKQFEVIARSYSDLLEEHERQEEAVEQVDVER
jgi:predicted adenylyl cyclase CyaB